MSNTTTHISTYKFDLDSPKSVLEIILGNPLFVVGVLGHVALLEAYDPKKDDFSPPSGVTGVPTKFRVAYIFGTPEGKLATKLGEMEGPIVFIDSITYRGSTDDNRLKWEITFTFKEVAPGRTRVTVINKTEEETGMLDRFLNKSQFNLADHVVKEHIIPFVKLYIHQAESLRESVVQGLVNYKKLAVEEGNVSEVMAKLMRLAKERKAEHTMITIQGDNYRGKVVLKDGKPVDASLKYTDGWTKTGNEALTEALSSTAKGKATLYSVDADNLVNNAFEEIYSEETAKAEEKDQT